jgi:transposase
MKFTDERRKHWLSLVEGGASEEDANLVVKVSSATVSRWKKLGREATEGPQFDFAQAYDALPKRRPKPTPGQLVAAEREGGLTEGQLVKLLEHAALDGSVPAIKYLLERPWEAKDAEQETKGPAIFDQLAALRERKTSG